MAENGNFYVLATIEGVEFFVGGFSLRRSKHVDDEAKKWGKMQIEALFRDEWELPIPEYTLRVLEELSDIPPLLVQAGEIFKNYYGGGTQ